MDLVINRNTIDIKKKQKLPAQITLKVTKKTGLIVI